MSSAGELFITEELTDTIAEDLAKILEGKNWRLRVRDYYDIWDRSSIRSGTVDIIDDNDKVLGTVEFKIDYYAEDLGYSNYVEIEIESYTIIANNQIVEKVLKDKVSKELIKEILEATGEVIESEDIIEMVYEKVNKKER